MAQTVNRLTRYRQKLMGLLLVQILIGCAASDGNWPKLSEPLPDPSERALEANTQPASVQTREQTRVARPTPAPQRLASTESPKKLWSVYLSEKRALEDALSFVQQAQEDRSLWIGAQIAATRANQALIAYRNRVMPIDATALDSVPSYTRTRIQKAEAFINDARATLASLKQS